jgi:isoleucyl-tRNA synthetase
LNSCGVFNNSPFKAVLTHGFIVDEKGKKMSKSLGNVITLDDVVKDWGADIFRMWVSNSDFTQDLKLGLNILKQLEDVYRKLRNTIRYMLGALAEYDAESEQIEYNDLPELEKWVLHRLAEIETELTICVDKYDVNKYFTILHTFCSGDLSSFFFDIRKDCLYCDHKNDHKRKSYRSVLYILFNHIVRRLAPIMVFTAEEAWLSFYKTSSIHLEEFLTPKSEWINPELFAKIDRIKEIRKSVTTAIEIARKNRILGSSLQANITVFDPENIIPITCEIFWEEVAITSGFKILNVPIPENAFVSDDLKNIGVVVTLAEGEKCERCWKISTSLVNQICERCQRVLAQKI